MTREETKYRLAVSGSAVFDVDGVATVVISNNTLKRWVISNTSVSATDGNPTATTYRGNVQLDSTRLGKGRSSDTVIELQSTESLTVVWSGGAPGAIASCSIIGDEYAVGRRAY